MERNGSYFWLMLAGIFGATGVAMGAFGSHALRPVLPLQAMAIFETAVRYQLFHALALFGCGLLAGLHPARNRLLDWAGGLFAVGTVLFSGSLYVLSMSDFRVAAWLTPLGGLSWIAAWVLLPWSARRVRRGS